MASFFWYIFLCMYFGIPLSKADDCTCVPYYLCINGTIDTSGSGIIDIRGGSPCDPNYMDTCCDEEDIVNEPILPLIASTKKPSLEGEDQGCGYRNPDGVAFRISGDEDNESQFGEFPWMVAILVQTMDENDIPTITYRCGASLIHPNAVLTAAHCIYNISAEDIIVRAGEWDTQTEEELYHHQNLQAAFYVVHPDFNDKSLFNDIALIFVKDAFNLGPNIDTICLPPADYITNDESCFATGWGVDVFAADGIYQAILKKVEMPIVERQECQQYLRRTRLSKYFKLHKSFVCAGGEPNQDSCRGDGGSPLACPIPGQQDRYMETGIVAWGIGCGQENIPGVYTHVSMFRRWIDAQMLAKNLDITHYNFNS